MRGSFGAIAFTVLLSLPADAAPQRPDSTYQKTLALELPTLPPPVAVHYSPGYGDRAAALQRGARALHNLLGDSLGLRIPVLTLLVLDSADWSEATELPYGLHTLLQDAPAFLAPAEVDRGIYYDDALGDLEGELGVDVVGLHYLVHFYAAEALYGHRHQVDPPVKWLDELFTLMLQDELLAAVDPALAEAAVRQEAESLRLDDPAVTTLAGFDREYRRAFVTREGADDYAWFVARLAAWGREIRREHGLGVLQRLRRALTESAAELDTPAALSLLEAAGIETHFWRDGGAAIAQTDRFLAAFNAGDEAAAEVAFGAQAEAHGFALAADWLTRVVWLLDSWRWHGLDVPPGPLSPDPRVEWLREHATHVRSIDPGHPDASDLEPLVSAIDDARVVLLGEATHGSGAALEAKGRLVPFFHERMGFDVLAFESGLFSMRRAAASLLATEPRSLTHPVGLFSVWARSDQVRPVLEYVRTSYGTTAPLALAGFDIQFSGDQNEPEAYRRALERFVDRADPTLLDVADREGLVEVFGSETVFGTGRTLTRDEFAEQRGSIDRMARRLRTARDRLRRAHSDRSIAFFERTLENAASLLALHETFAFPPDDLDWRWTTDVRDTAMAANLAWLASDRYPDRKIIGWAANFHIARNLDSVDTMDSAFSYVRETPMGAAAHSVFGDDLYTVGFLAYDGRHGDPTPRPLEPAPENSLEWLLHQVGNPYLFVDFSALPQDHWLREPIVARPFGYVPMKADWTRVFDGVFFIDIMYPNTLMDAEVPR